MDSKGLFARWMVIIEGDYTNVVEDKACVEWLPSLEFSDEFRNATDFYANLCWMFEGIFIRN